MRIDIPQEEKVLLGRWIDKKRRQNLKSEGKSYRIDFFTEGECAKATYHKLTHGIALQESEHYDKLLKKLGYHYPYDEDFTGLYATYEKSLSALDIKTLLTEMKKLWRDLKVYESFPYLSTTRRVIEELIILKKPNDLKKPVFQSILEDFIFIPDAFKDGFAAICLYYFQEAIQDKTFLPYMKEVGIINEHSSIRNKNLWLNVLVTSNLYYDATVLCEELKSAIPEENSLQYFQILLSEAFLALSIQPDKFEKISQKLQQHPVMKKREDSVYHLIALRYFLTNQEEKAYPYFLKALQNKKDLFPDLLYCYYISGKYNYELPAWMREKINVDKEEYCVQVLYKFYWLKLTNHKASTLENHIVNHCKYILKEFIPPFIIKNILDDEFKRLSAITGHTSSYYHFRAYKIKAR